MKQNQQNQQKEEQKEEQKENEIQYDNENELLFDNNITLNSFLEYNYNDLNLTYRSINIENDFIISSNLTSSSSSKLSSKLPSNEIINQNNNNNNNQIQKKEKEFKIIGINVPKLPFYVGYSKFNLNMIIDDIIEGVENCLNQIIELDYQFIQNYCKWDVVYLRGSTFCHFEISIFDDNNVETSTLTKYLLEGNRLSGDGLAFRLVFNKLKESLLSVSTYQPKSSFPISPYLQSLPVPSISSPFLEQIDQEQQKSNNNNNNRSVNIPSIKSQPISNMTTLCSSIKPSFDMNSPDADDEFKDYLIPILSMIDPSSPIDIQIEGIKILCDLTMSIELHRLLVDCKCIEKLIAILTNESNSERDRERDRERRENFIIGENNFENENEFNYKRNYHDQSYHCHYVLYAIANMSTYRPCQNILVSNDEFLAFLLSKITNGSHITAEMRRECARTLANLCVGLAPKIIRALGRQFTTNWIESIDGLKDERLKLHAERAKMYIQNCF